MVLPDLWWMMSTLPLRVQSSPSSGRPQKSSHMPSSAANLTCGRMVSTDTHKISNYLISLSLSSLPHPPPLSGILLWELWTGGKTPYPTFTNSQVLDEVLMGYRLERPKLCPVEIYTFMKQCWLAVSSLGGSLGVWWGCV